MGIWGSLAGGVSRKGLSPRPANQHAKKATHAGTRSYCKVLPPSHSQEPSTSKN